MMKLNRQLRRGCGRKTESGYVLLSLLLIIALMIIVAASIVTSISFDIKRDREEEMIHRGVQYSRAIKAYYKKFGRYPAKIEDLESANNQRFLRKRYKDPLSCHASQCADFKLLHFGEVKLSMTGGIAGGTIPGANPAGGNPLNNAGGIGAGGIGQNNAFGGNSGFGNSVSAFGQSPAYGQNPQQSSPVAGGDPTQPNAQGTAPNQPGQDNSNANETNNAGGNSSGASRDQLANTTFGGGPVIGVASVCKDVTIREYNHKKKYNEWQFVYDPALDRGGLITTPYQPMAAFGQLGITPNLNGQINGTSSSPFGTGQPPAGMQNNPNLPVGGGFGNPIQQNNPPPAQQQ